MDIALRRILFSCVCLLSGAATPILAADPIATTCSTTDHFTFTDLGVVMDSTKVGVPVGTPIADHAMIYRPDGKINLYFNEGGNGGVRRAVLGSGLTFDLQSGYVAGLPRIPNPKNGQFKILKLEDGRYRMYMGGIDVGIHSYISSDAITFTEEEGQRVTNAAAGFRSLNWLSIAPKAGGGYRGYFTDTPTPDTNYGQIKSATSTDLMNWTMDSGIRIGPDAATLTGKVQQPFALARANGCVTLFYFKGDNSGVPGLSPTGIYYSTSTDGLSFFTEYFLGIGNSNGPDVLRLNDGTYWLSYDGGRPTEGFWISVGVLQLSSAVPGAPTNLTASVGATTVSLSWNPPTSGSTPTSYVLEAGSASGSANLYNQDIGNVTSLTATAPARTYFVRVRGSNAAGTGDPSNEVSFTLGNPPCTTAPGSVSGLSASSSGSAVRLSWAASTTGSPATTYVLVVGSIPGASNLLVQETGSTSTSFTGSAPPGVYYVRVLARNACGTSGPSNEVVVAIAS